jgi:hypothetical protein
MKALRNLLLFAAASAAMLFLWALFMVASQSSDPTGLYHASIIDWPSLAVGHIKKNLAVFLRWGMVVFVVLPIITQTILYMRRDHNSNTDSHTATEDAGPRSQTAWEQLSQAKAARLADPSPVGQRRHVS